MSARGARSRSPVRGARPQPRAASEPRALPEPRGELRSEEQVELEQRPTKRLSVKQLPLALQEPGVTTTPRRQSTEILPYQAKAKARMTLRPTRPAPPSPETLEEHHRDVRARLEEEDSASMFLASQLSIVHKEAFAAQITSGKNGPWPEFREFPKGKFTNLMKKFSMLKITMLFF